MVGRAKYTEYFDSWHNMIQGVAVYSQQQHAFTGLVTWVRDTDIIVAICLETNRTLFRGWQSGWLPALSHASFHTFQHTHFTSTYINEPCCCSFVLA